MGCQKPNEPQNGERAFFRRVSTTIIINLLLTDFKRGKFDGSPLRTAPNACKLLRWWKKLELRYISCSELPTKGSKEKGVEKTSRHSAAQKSVAKRIMILAETNFTGTPIKTRKIYLFFDRWSHFKNNGLSFYLFQYQRSLTLYKSGVDGGLN